MAKLDALFEVQLGIEATDAWGTEVATTVKLMGVEELTINPGMVAEQVNELRGTLQPGYRSHVRKIEPSASMSGLLEIDDFPFLLASLGANSVGTTDIAGTYTYTLTAPTEDTDTYEAESFTLMKTDRVDTYSLLGATVSELTIEGESGGPLTYSAEFMGKIVTTDVFADLSDRVTTPAMGHMGELYIDLATDAVGTTPIANEAYSFSLGINPNRKFLNHLGDLSPSGFREGKWEGTLSLSIEASTNTYPYLDAIIGSTSKMPEKNVQLVFTASSDEIVTFDFSGVMMEAPELYSDEDGVVTFDFDLVGQAHEGGSMASFFVATVLTSTDIL